METPGHISVAINNQAISGPITSIACSLGVAHQDTSDIDATPRLARAIDRSAKSAANIISTLNQISYLLKCSQSRTSANMADLVRVVASDFVGQGKYFGQLVTNVPNLPNVRVDVAQIRRVLEEVVNHSISAEIGGEAAARIDIRVHLSGGEVRTEVASTDKAPVDLENLFALFGGRSSEHKLIGLSVARALAVANEGRLWAERGDNGTLRIILAFPPEEKTHVD